MKKFVIFLVITAVILGIACMVTDYYDSHTDSAYEINNNVQQWNLVLVNKYNKMTKSIEPTLITTANGEKIAEKIYPSLKKMFEDAEKEGFLPEVTSGYRSEEEQEDLYDGRVREYRHLGHSKKEAVRLTNKYAAKPGFSEHQTGLAADINSKVGDSRELYTWLEVNSYKYGFILRYPQGKEDITGIEYEPWHYRYVGTEAAEYIYHNDMTLEEYLMR